MRLTDYTDYSLRVLIYVAVHPNEPPVKIQNISDTFGISKNHLIKIVQHLGQTGYLHTSRGRSDSIRLGLPAKDINLGELVRTTESDLGLVECFLANNQCVITRSCALLGILNQALHAFLEGIDGYSLQDLVAKPVGLKRSL